MAWPSGGDEETWETLRSDVQVKSTGLADGGGTWGWGGGRAQVWHPGFWLEQEGEFSEL